MFVKAVALLSLLVFESCDLTNVDALDDPKIIGGETSPIDYPYQISLQYYVQAFLRNHFTHICGGSILNENYFVTAAHCVKDANISYLSVLAGTTDLKNTTQAVRLPVDSCLIHPNYVKLNTSDIALCKVRVPFVLEGNIEKINIDSNYVGPNINATLTGWGSTWALTWLPFQFLFGFIYPDKLQRANLITISNDNCSSAGMSVDDTQICTAMGMGKGACSGDSGGPLAFNGVLVGLVSFGTSVCAAGRPDVFTRVSTFFTWINSNMALQTLTNAASTANTVVSNIVSSLPNVLTG